MQRGEHFAVCPSYGVVGGPCRGCRPKDAAPGSLICGGCFARTSAMLAETPDLVAHIRGLMDPLKAMDYSKEPGGGGGGKSAPPPVPVELLDAVDYIITVLWSATEVLNGRDPVGRQSVSVATTEIDLLVYARKKCRDLLGELSDFARRPEIGPFVDAVIGHPASSLEWTIATAYRRWSIADEPWWAAQHCPMVDCGTRAVKVTPPVTPGDETNYRCHKCGWEPANDDDGFWAECFSRREGKAA